MPDEVTGFEAGLSGDDQIRIALREIADRGGTAQMADIYAAVERQMQGRRLSHQGGASLRFFVNRVAVRAGYIYPHDPTQRDAWRITPEGRELLLEAPPEPEQVINTDTQQPEAQPSNSARGAAFEHHVLGLLRKAYPFYSWYHQGRDKRLERGLDFVGTRIGDIGNEPRSIGVQVKFHKPNGAPTQQEWLSFLAGCFARRVDHAIFVTSGRLRPEQRREAGEAKVVVLAGRDEIARIGEQHQVARFDLFEDSPESDEST
jgi:hypothetical protein